ncbi:MAG: YkvA family protein [Kiritimatiellia bacterium]|jgi:uncharacterized membrane protein YkvA (DUF1232 family)
MVSRPDKPLKHPTQLSEADAARAEATLAHGVEVFDEEMLSEVLADEETVKTKAGHLGDKLEDVKLLWRLLVDYAHGNYRAPWRLIAAVGFAFLYLILPIDIIPDFLPGLGYLDDASVFGMVLRASQIEIAAYRAWLAAQVEAAKTLSDTSAAEPELPQAERRAIPVPGRPGEDS